jgi:hypothetical protein
MKTYLFEAATSVTFYSAIFNPTFVRVYMDVVSPLAPHTLLPLVRLSLDVVSPLAPHTLLPPLMMN